MNCPTYRARRATRRANSLLPPLEDYSWDILRSLVPERCFLGLVEYGERRVVLHNQLIGGLDNLVVRLSL